MMIVRNGIIKGIKGVKLLRDNKLLQGFGIFIEKLCTDFSELPRWMNEWEYLWGETFKIGSWWMGRREHLWVQLPPILIPDGLDKGRGRRVYSRGSKSPIRTSVSFENTQWRKIKKCNKRAKAQSAQMFQPVTVLDGLVPNPNKTKILLRSCNLLPEYVLM